MDLEGIMQRKQNAMSDKDKYLNMEPKSQSCKTDGGGGGGWGLEFEFSKLTTS